MEAFEYAHPTTQHEAIGLLGSSWNDAAVLAGGTDLISLMKEYVVTPKRVVNIKNVEGLNGIHSNGDGVRIAAVAHQRLGRAEATVAGAGEDRKIVRVEIGDGQVEASVAVEVGRYKRVRVGPGEERMELRKVDRRRCRRSPHGQHSRGCRDENPAERASVPHGARLPLCPRLV